MINKTIKKQWYPSVLLMSAAMLLMVGCASTGSRSMAAMKISESEKAISIARENNANPNSFVDLRVAEDGLAKANQALRADEYLKATRLAEKATVDADCARIEAKALQARKDADALRENIKNMQQDSAGIQR
jgi:hypothetical protein